MLNTFYISIYITLKHIFSHIAWLIFLIAVLGIEAVRLKISLAA